MKKNTNKKAFSLIEILIAMFMLSVVLVGMLAVFSGSMRAYQKQKATKRVMDDFRLAISAIAKDIRMGKVMDNTWSGGNKYLQIRRTRDLVTVCYYINDTDLSLTVAESLDDPAPVCSDSSWAYDQILYDFDSALYAPSANAKFFSRPTSATERGAVEINLGIRMKSGSEMESDSIDVQTVVSSRDYGW